LTTDHVTYCPYKGDAITTGVPAGGKKSVNAVWLYEDPFPAVEQIKGACSVLSRAVDEIAAQLQREEENSMSWTKQEKNKALVLLLLKHPSAERQILLVLDPMASLVQVSSTPSQRTKMGDHHSCAPTRAGRPAQAAPPHISVDLMDRGRQRPFRPLIR